LTEDISIFVLDCILQRITSKCSLQQHNVHRHNEKILHFLPASHM